MEQKRKLSARARIIIVCLLGITVCVTVGYVETRNELIKTKTELEIYRELALEYWAKEQLAGFLGTEITQVDMVSRFVYDVRVANGTSFTFETYDGSWHIK